MGLFDSDEQKRRERELRAKKIAEEAAQKARNAKIKVKAAAKRQKQLTQRRALSEGYLNPDQANPYSATTTDSSGDKNTPPVSLGRGLGCSSSTYNKNAYSRKIQDPEAKSSTGSEAAFPKLNRGF